MAQSDVRQAAGIRLIDAFLRWFRFSVIDTGLRHPVAAAA